MYRCPVFSKAPWRHACRSVGVRLGAFLSSAPTWGRKWSGRFVPGTHRAVGRVGHTIGLDV